MSIKILHFADAHIDMISGGKRDPKSGLPVRMLDFLHSLDQIVDCAIDEKVDLVLFAGDAYRDAIPGPTDQREWGRRMKRLADSHIPVLMIDGNHDVSPTVNKASSMQEFNTYKMDYLHLAKNLQLWGPDDLDGVPVQVLTLPFFPKGRFAAMHQTSEAKGTSDDVFAEMEAQITERVETCIAESDPALPLILLAHYSVQGASFSSKQVVTLGKEPTLSASLIKNRAFSYVALGHIHIFQDLNSGMQPPVVYSGSIERVNFGESGEDKGFVIAHVSQGHTEYEFRKINCRPMFNRELTITSMEQAQEEIMNALPDQLSAAGAMVKLVIKYPQAWESAIDEKELRKHMSDAFEFHLVRRPEQTGRMRFDEGEGISSLPPHELLKKYCASVQISEDQSETLCKLAEEIFTTADEKRA